MLQKVYKPFSDLSKSVIYNSVASVIFAITILIFSLVRTSLIERIYGLSSIGLLSIIIGILPYISSTHGGIISVAKYHLYEKIFRKQYSKVNETISNIKVQYYFFGFIYLTIILILSFSFPFFFKNGEIITGSEVIPWYESTLFILSNCIETIANYFIVPISIIIFYILKKSYISNFINILTSIFFNAIIITLLLLTNNHVIELSFINMNIIITILLGLRVLVVLLILKPIRDKKITWYKRHKITNKKISKKMITSVISQYLTQFNSEIYSIVFILATILIPQIELRHGVHPPPTSNGLDASGIYYIFVFLIMSSYEVIHSIVDCSVPSMAEHIIFNKKINFTYFKRYQMLIVMIVTYCITTYLFTVGFSSISIMNISHLNNPELILMFIIVVPIYIDSHASTYTHLLPLFGEFNKILKFTIIKVIFNVFFVILFCLLFCYLLPISFLISSILISLVLGWSLSSFIHLMIIKKYIINKIENYNSKELLIKNLYSSLYILFTVISMSFIFGYLSHNIEDAISDLGIGLSILVIITISLSNFFIILMNLKITRKSEYNYFLKEFICMKNHYLKKKRLMK